jgi:hypothetical protein
LPDENQGDFSAKILPLLLPFDFAQDKAFDFVQGAAFDFAQGASWLSGVEASGSFVC